MDKILTKITSNVTKLKTLYSTSLGIRRVKAVNSRERGPPSSLAEREEVEDAQLGALVDRSFFKSLFCGLLQ